MCGSRRRTNKKVRLCLLLLRSGWNNLVFALNACMTQLLTLLVNEHAVPTENHLEWFSAHLNGWTENTNKLVKLSSVRVKMANTRIANDCHHSWCCCVWVIVFFKTFHCFCLLLLAVSRRQPNANQKRRKTHNFIPGRSGAPRAYICDCVPTSVCDCYYYLIASRLRTHIFHNK